MSNTQNQTPQDGQTYYNGWKAYAKMKEVLGDNPEFLLGNVVKYVYRYDKKGTPLEDLQKAKVYLNKKLGELGLWPTNDPGLVGTHKDYARQRVYEYIGQFSDKFKNLLDSQSEAHWFLSRTICLNEIIKASRYLDCLIAIQKQNEPIPIDEYIKELKERSEDLLCRLKKEREKSQRNVYFFEVGRRYGIGETETNRNTDLCVEVREIDYTANALIVYDGSPELQIVKCDNIVGEVLVFGKD